MTLSQVHVESGVVVVTLGEEWTNADVVALVDTIGSLIRGDNGVRRVLVRIEGETPQTLLYVVGLLDREARDRGGKHVELAPSAV
jgi:hypothetical protein